jgi:hypothetical protein
MRLTFVALVAATALVLPAPAIGKVIAQGSFGPTEKYTGRGKATVVRNGAGDSRFLRLSRDFRAFNAVKLALYLATSAAAETHINLGAMKDRGAQRFLLPESVNLKRYKYVIAWCIEVDEPITQAILR